MDTLRTAAMMRKCTSQC